MGSNTEIMSSMIGGALQVVATQPLNNIMNAKQAGKKFTINFKGIVPATIGNATTIGVVFYVEAKIRRYVPNVYLSAGIVGGINSIVTSPFENIRIRKVLHLPQLYTPRILYRGMASYFPREVIAWSCYIGSYNSLRKNDVHPLIAGGFAGWFSWFTTYPIDVIKTRIQGSNTMKYQQAIEMGNLWKGFGYCSARAIIGNSICFYTYETLKSSSA